MIPISYYLILSTIIFSVSIAGIFINRKNILVLLMSLELMFLSVNFNLITLGNYLGDLTGQVFVYFELDNFYQNHRTYVKSRSND